MDDPYCLLRLFFFMPTPQFGTPYLSAVGLVSFLEELPHGDGTIVTEQSKSHFSHQEIHRYSSLPQVVLVDPGEYFQHVSISHPSTEYLLRERSLPLPTWYCSMSPLAPLPQHQHASFSISVFVISLQARPGWCPQIAWISSPFSIACLSPSAASPFALSVHGDFHDLALTVASLWCVCVSPCGCVGAW